MRTFGRAINVRPNGGRRRGTVVPLVASSMVMLLGFGALAIDMGILYDTRAELQRTADASATGAAAELAAAAGGDAMTNARIAAGDFAAMNRVLNAPLLLDPETDIVFGRAHIDPNTNKYVFEASTTFPNAVRVITRRTELSPSGPVPTIFANVMGVAGRDVSAQAMAVLVPRDIVFVLDLSRSHCYDSSLRHYRLTEIGNRDVWTNMWDTQRYGVPPVSGTGPSMGNMNTWGDAATGPSWACASDPGLVRLQRGSNWSLSSTYASQTLNAKGYGTYTTAEMNVINSSSGAGAETSYTDSTQRANYRRRTLVALGIYRWKSGKTGGQSGGDGDNVIEAGEVVQMVPFPTSASGNPDTKSKEITGTWDEYVDYVAETSKSNTSTSLSSPMLKYTPDAASSDSRYWGNPDLRWRFGLKTFVDYPQERHSTYSESPALAGLGEQPMGSVAQAVQESIDIIQGLESSDLIGTAAYGQYGYSPSTKTELAWLTNDYAGVRSKVGGLQAGMWTSSTNISQGIDKGVEVLFDANHGARVEAAKIMILLTDGNANVRRNGASDSSGVYACQDAIQAAADAQTSHGQRVRIYCVSVGADANQDVMEQIAQIGGGQHFHAEGSVTEYREQLQNIFRNLGGKRPVVLAD